MSFSRSRPQEFWTGARDIIPLIVGAIPFCIIFGTLATSNGLSAGATLAMSTFVFAGSSQFIAAGMVATNTGWLLIVLTTFVVNLRHLLYAVSLVQYVKELSQWWKVPLAFLLTDESFAVAIRRYEAGIKADEKSPFQHWYFFGAAIAMYVNWQLCTFLGITLGQMIPDATGWGLDFAMSVTFIGIIVPYLKNKPMVISVIVAGFVAVATASLPNKLGLMLAALAGISAGVTNENLLRNATTSQGTYHE